MTSMPGGPWQPADGSEQYAPGQPWAGQYGQAQPGQAQPSQSPYPPGQQWPGGYGADRADAARQGQAAGGQPWHGHGQPGFGQPGTGPGGPGAGQYGPENFTSGQAGPGQYGAGPYDDGQYGQYGQPIHHTGSWQAAGPSQGQQAWAAGTGQYGAGAGDPGSWQAAGPDQGYQNWTAAPGQYNAGMHHTGSWQAAPPDQGQQGWAGPGQYGAGVRGTGSWRAAEPGRAPGGPQQPYPGQPADGQPYPGQPYPGQPFPAQGQPGDQDGWHGQQPYGGPAPGMRSTGAFGRIGSPVIRQRDSALPDPPPDGKMPIAALENDNVGAFARDLRVLRARTGLDYPDMAEKSHYTMRTLASAAGGLRLPTLPVLIAYVNACGGDVSEWEERWGRLMKSGRKGNAALPAAGYDASTDDPSAAPDGAGSGLPGTGQIPQNARQTGEIYVITSAPSRDDRW